MVEQSYEVGGVVFGVRANTDAAAEWMLWALAEYQTDDNIDPYYSLFVGDGAGSTKRFHILYEESREVVKTLDLANVGKALLSRLTAFELQGRNDALYVEAGFAAVGGRHVLLPGDILDWLATINRRKLERAGVALSLESCFVLDPALATLSPVQPTLRVPPEAVDRLAVLAPGEDGDRRVTPTGPVTVDAIALNGLSDQVRRVGPGAAAYEVAQRIRNLEVLGGAGLLALRPFADTVPAYELPAWNPGMMLDHLATTFGAA